MVSAGRIAHVIPYWLEGHPSTRAIRRPLSDPPRALRIFSTISALWRSFARITVSTTLHGRSEIGCGLHQSSEVLWSTSRRSLAGREEFPANSRVEAETESKLTYVGSGRFGRVVRSR